MCVGERESIGEERVPYYQGMRVLIKHRSCRGPEVRCTCNEWRNLTHPIIGSQGKNPYCYSGQGAQMQN